MTSRGKFERYAAREACMRRYAPGERGIREDCRIEFWRSAVRIAGDKPANTKAHISMLSRVIAGLLIFAAGAGGAWYFKSIVSISQVPAATASSTRGAN